MLRTISYLNSIAGPASLTDAQTTKLNQLTTDLCAAQDKLDAYESACVSDWLADALAQSRKQTFQAWINAKRPLYNQYKKQRDAANSVLTTYTNEVYGPSFSVVNNDRSKFLLGSDVMDAEEG